MKRSVPTSDLTHLVLDQGSLAKAWARHRELTTDEIIRCWTALNSYLIHNSQKKLAIETKIDTEVCPVRSSSMSSTVRLLAN